MRRSILVTAALFGVLASIAFTAVQPVALAHCEVPCGIYDDHARIVQMLEDTKTIAKAVDQITALAEQDDAQSFNQATRWVATKEEHATRIQHTIAQYFMTQRIKPVGPESPDWNSYARRLAQHQVVLVAAMKTKQSVDPAAVAKLQRAIEVIAPYYPAPGSDHTHDHDSDHAQDHDHGHDHDH